jgi:alcohol dehydrogenase (quinone), cytochrome c subunit
MPLPRRSSSPIAIALFVALIGTCAISRSDDSASAAPTPTTSTPVERGRYLAAAGNCFSCHTREGGAPFTGGVAFETPLGTIYSTNITPDKDTGIGDWKLADLRRAMHEGIAADGGALFPAFPYPSYTKVSDADVAAIYAFLRTLQPVKYTVPDNSAWFWMRWPMRIWNAMFFKPGRYTANASKDDEWNRGAYLVEGLGHCSACHTPRNWAMAEIPERAFQGGVLLDKVTHHQRREWSAVDLTQSKHGIASWSVNDLTKYLHTGFSARAGTFGPMNEVIVNSLKKLDEQDVRAMAVYLKSLPARAYTGAKVTEEQAKAGAAIYEEHCEECHSSSGRGGIFKAPPVAGSAIVQADNPASLVNVLLHGPSQPKEVSFGSWETMPAFADKLSDQEIVAVSNYLRGSWSNVGRALTVEDVTRQR